MLEIETGTMFEIVRGVEFGIDFAIAKIKYGKAMKVILVTQEFTRVKPDSEKFLEKPEVIELCKVK